MWPTLAKDYCGQGSQEVAAMRLARWFASVNLQQRREQVVSDAASMIQHLDLTRGN